jgi:HicA toxin of bacterial toxin-antitoxin,
MSTGSSCDANVNKLCYRWTLSQGVVVAVRRTEGLSGKHRRVLEDVFADPGRASIAWHDIEALFRALGATIGEGRGSRVHVKLGEVFASFHRPHPRKETNRGAVRSVRVFLNNAGIKP